jgi:DNA-binding MarR family transcriptional regulator
MSQTPISPLDVHVGYWMRLVSNHVSHAFKLKVEERGVTVAEWVVLRVLFDADRLHPSDVAERMGMTRGAISKLLERLSAKKLVAVTIERGDRRYQSVCLTAAGRKIVPVLAALADINDAEFFGHLPATKRSALVELLKEIVGLRGLDEVPVD